MNTLRTHGPARRGARSETSTRWVLATLALCALLPSLGTSIANVALPNFAQIYGAPLPQVQWVVIAYLLATTTLVVGAGRLGDIVGRRRLLTLGILLFSLASVLCALAPALPWLIAARALQGAGAAIMMALTMTFVAGVVPKEQAGTAMGLLGTMSAIGTALGPTLGGALIAGFGWPAIFWVGAPLGLVAWALVRHVLPADRAVSKSGRAGFDAVGTLTLALSLAAYALAMTLGRGNFGASNLALLLVAVIGAGVFLRTQARASSPLVSPAHLRDTGLQGSLATSAIVATVVMATLVVGPYYLAGALGLDPVWVGVVMSAGPVAAALAGVPAGRLVDRFGAWRMTVVGLAGMTLGCVGLSLAPATLGIAGYVSAIVITTTHYAVFQTANNTGVMSGIATDQRGTVSGLLNLARNLGLITGASLMGAIFAFVAGAGDFDGAAPDALTRGMRATFGVAALMVAVALALALGASRRSREDERSGA